RRSPDVFSTRSAVSPRTRNDWYESSAISMTTATAMTKPKRTFGGSGGPERGPCELRSDVVVDSAIEGESKMATRGFGKMIMGTMVMQAAHFAVKRCATARRVPN